MIREHDAFLGHEMRGPAGLGVVAREIMLFIGKPKERSKMISNRCLGGGKAKAQRRGMG